ncbi:MAG: hypothetical protein A2161_14365 [Candidatus Schekmanbacteria bacterium RBG_13_48_7]|uniref:SLH domain-containing protein n=1 Tax=Candidatus Schekmanbacteria bacterium RBG_13_48_7 TaxID=1817878 RepID=A0A1F7RPS4_9BACT|nr:MAG: hypothetical protein A2161_14365 [Candidatus Schekmanbacteria bacterium RBG_13_48_7]
MKRTVGLIFAMVLICFCNLPNAAATSFDYNEGMIDIPTADVLDHLQLKAAYVTSYWDSLEEENNEDAASINIGLFDRVEIGLTGHTWEFWDFSSYDEANNFVGNVAVKVLDEDKTYPAIAVGVQQISGDDTVYYRGYKTPSTGVLRSTIGKQNNSVFAVMSKTLLDKNNRYKVRGHFGVGTHHYAFKDENKRIYPYEGADYYYYGNKGAGVFGGLEFDYYFFDFFSNYLLKDLVSNFGDRPWDDEKVIADVESRTGYYMTNDEVFALKNAPNPEKMLYSVLNKKKNLVRLMVEFDGKDSNLGVQYVHDWFDIGFALADLSGANKEEGDYANSGLYWLEALKFNMGVSLKTFHRDKDVIINDPGRNLEEIVEVVAQITGKDYSEVRQLLQASPVTILKNRPYIEAKFLVQHLNELGASSSMD